MAHRFIEVLVVAYFTVVGATDLQRINCKGNINQPHNNVRWQVCLWNKQM